MIQTRKQFLNTASFSMFGLLIAPNLLSNEISEGKPVIMHADEGETYWIGMRNSPLTIKIAKDHGNNTSMSLCTELIAPAEDVPVHKHLNEDELIFIHTGEGMLTVGDDDIPVRKGSVALIPKGIWHGLKNIGSDPLLMVFSYSPAGFEGYFRELGSPAGTPWQPKSKEAFEKLDKKWGIVYR